MPINKVGKRVLYIKLLVNRNNHDELEGSGFYSEYFRDIFLYASSVDSRGLDETVEILGETTLRPLFTDEEMELSEMMIRFELEDLAMRPDQEPLLVEQIHAAAYRKHNLI